MKAVVQQGYGSAEVLELREVEKPAVADDCVLVRVRAASINAADYHLIHMPWPGRLAFGWSKPKDPIRGVDLSGQVEAVGARVTRFKPGDEVFGTGRGTFAEYACAREDHLAPKPQRLSFEQAAAVPAAGYTALQGLRDKARLQPGQRVLIYGAGGGVGTMAVQIAKALGAHVTAATRGRNIDMIRSLGPDAVLNLEENDHLRGRRYDVFFDVAATRPLRECLRVLESNGTFVAVGAAKRHWVRVLTRLLALASLSRVVRQRMVTFVAKAGREDLLTLQNLIEDEKLTPVIEREYALAEVPDAIRYMADGAARAKVVIRVS
jgi:NADPH:quinone reductase-like Zn-dependent oxidoreductase